VAAIRHAGSAADPADDRGADVVVRIYDVGRCDVADPGLG
jgi:hypothetical protein